MMKVSLVLIFVGVALLCARQSEGGVDYSYSYQIEVCDGGESQCPPVGQPDYDECCKYFKDSCCTHSENEKLKTIFIVVIVVSVLSFVSLIACVVGIIACCCCAVCSASTTPRTTRTVVTTGYTPVPSNVVVANTTTNTMMRPV